jgi:predicted transcriptional regulator
VRLAPEVKDRLMALAALRGATAAHLVEEALLAYFGRLRPAERADVETLLAAAHLGQPGGTAH